MEIKNITIYTIPGCPYCRSAKEFLKKNNLAYNEISVPSDKDARTILDKFSRYFPDDNRGVPVMVITDKNGKEHCFNDESDSTLHNLLGIE